MFPRRIGINNVISHILLLALILPGLITIVPVRAGASTKSQHPSSSTVDKTTPSQPVSKEVDEATRERVGNALSSLPLRFEENQGRVDKQVRFISRGQGYQLFLTPTEAVLSLRQGTKKKDKAKDKAASHAPKLEQSGTGKMSVVRMQLLGANRKAEIKGEQPLETPTNYFIGNDKSKWHAANNYGRVRYEQVYRGIDMTYYGKQQQLEYDFEVSPGADPKAITMQFKGVKKLRIDDEGELVIKVRGGGEVRQHRPVTYQVINGERREIESEYVLKGKNRVGFKVGEYDRSEKLVIDPVLSYSSYLGGNSSDVGNGIAVDASGNAYVTGYTSSTDFPTLNEYQVDQTDTDVFVTKLNTNASGNASLLYSTYLGGGDYDEARGIAVDSSGNTYVTGFTNSTDFPTLNQFQANAQTDNNTNRDVFVTKLNANLSGNSSLLYSTYLGGNFDDVGNGIAADSSGNAYVTGNTESTNFPTLNEYQDEPLDSNADAFVTKLNTNQSGNASLLYSTYLGGNNNDVGTGIAVDSTGNAYVTGYTQSTDFPTLNQYQLDPGDNESDVFVTKLNTNQSGTVVLLYSTYLGGSGYDEARGIAVDSSGNAYVTGLTQSTNFPTLNQFQVDQTGADVFVTKLNTNESGNDSLLYSTYLGGSGTDAGNGIAVDSSGNAYITGLTTSTNFPTLNQFQVHQAGVDAFVTRLNTNLSGNSSLLYSTYLGGSGNEFGNGIAVDTAGNAYVTGFTTSTDFPTLNQYQLDPGDNDADVFVTKLRQPSVIADFDGDRRTDPSIWNPTNHNWYFIDSSTNQPREHQDWGNASLGDIAVPRDYDGDSKTDIAVWRAPEGNWYIRNSSNNSVTVINWGTGSLGDVPVPADYDGDGKADLAVWRGSEGNWYILNSRDNTVTVQNWGTSTLGDKPVLGDYDGDGKADLAVWREAEGNWYILNSSNNTVTVRQWGDSALGDKPVQSDYDRDGRTDIAIWRGPEGNWYIINSGDGSITVRQWGGSGFGDVPVPGDYDGDGKADLAVWREPEGNWYILQSSDNSVRVVNLGSSCDVPAPVTYLPLNTYYRDADADGFGANDQTVLAYSKPCGYVSTVGDCNDSNPATFPGAVEICDGEDNNCNSQIDEGVCLEE